jgi:hypothetical protein
MVWSTQSESLINVVSFNKPKMLTGLNQKVRDQVSVLLPYRSQMLRHRRRGETYPMQVHKQNVVSP